MEVPVLQLDQLKLSREIVAAMREALATSGIRGGTLYVGAILRLPESVYFLWHLTGEVPVTMTIPSESLSEPELARVAVEEFIMRWKQMIF